jgi:hypothetical protein
MTLMSMGQEGPPRTFNDFHKYSSYVRKFGGPPICGAHVFPFALKGQNFAFETMILRNLTFIISLHKLTVGFLLQSVMYIHLVTNGSAVLFGKCKEISLATWDI